MKKQRKLLSALAASLRGNLGLKLLSLLLAIVIYHTIKDSFGRFAIPQHERPLSTAP